MKRFQLVTEADARVLEYGSAIVLAAGGHVTPLARDTLASRGVTVVLEGIDPDAPDLAPSAAIRVVAVAGDEHCHGLAGAVIAHLRSRGCAAHDLGSTESHPRDYADAASAAALAVARQEADAAVVIDRVGVASAIAANKVPGARSAVCLTEAVARHAREEAGANVLALGASAVSLDEALAIVDGFLGTSMRDAGAIRRLAKIRDLERRPRR